MSETATPPVDPDQAAFEAMRDEAAPAPEAPATPAAPAANDPPPAERRPQRLVPHAALHEERTRRQQLEREIADLRSRVQQPQQPATPTRDPEEIDETQDPLGAIAQLKNYIKTGHERARREHEERQAVDALNTRVQARVNAYVAEHPEYPEQVKFLRASRGQELQDLGYSPQEIVRQIYQEEMALGARAIQLDMDPGEMVAKLAAGRGWKAPAITDSPAAPAVPDAGATERIERLERGRRIAKSPSAAGGGAPAAELTLEQIANLDGAAFDKAFAAHAKRLMA
jgi:hypothetical protein